MGFNSGFKGLIYLNRLLCTSLFFHEDVTCRTGTEGVFSHTRLHETAANRHVLLQFHGHIALGWWQIVVPGIHKNHRTVTTDALSDEAPHVSKASSTVYWGLGMKPSSTYPSECRLRLKCDGTRWRTGEEVKGKLANGVVSQQASHDCRTQACASSANHAGWCAQLAVVDWTDSPADLNGLVPCAERRNPVSARVPSHFKRSLLPPLSASPFISFCSSEHPLHTKCFSGNRIVAIC